MKEERVNHIWKVTQAKMKQSKSWTQEHFTASRDNRLSSYFMFIQPLTVKMTYQIINTKAVLTFFQDDFLTWQTSCAKIPQIDGNDSDFSDKDEPDAKRSRHSAGAKVMIT